MIPGFYGTLANPCHNSREKAKALTVLLEQRKLLPEELEEKEAKCTKKKKRLLGGYLE